MSESTAAFQADANSHQVGGDHYKTGGLEHWDLLPPAYLVGCASKYVSRHMEKGGREDLEKAVHYCVKFAQVIGDKAYTNTLRVERMLEWARNTRMTGYEIVICYEILCAANMEKAVQLLHMLIRLRYPEQTEPAPVVLEKVYSAGMRGAAAQALQDHQSMLPQNRPGTPEDGGHHARQPVEEEGEEIMHWTRENALDSLIPPSLSVHEWQYRCDPEVQECYEYNVSAARYIIKDEHRRKTLGYAARA